MRPTYLIKCSKGSWQIQICRVLSGVLFGCTFSRRKTTVKSYQEIPFELHSHSSSYFRHPLPLVTLFKWKKREFRKRLRKQQFCLKYDIYLLTHKWYSCIFSVWWKKAKINISRDTTVMSPAVILGQQSTLKAFFFQRWVSCSVSDSNLCTHVGSIRWFLNPTYLMLVLAGQLSIEQEISDSYLKILVQWCAKFIGNKIQMLDQSLKLFLKIFSIYVIIQLRFLEWVIQLILEEIACRPTSKIQEECIN